MRFKYGPPPTFSQFHLPPIYFLLAASAASHVPFFAHFMSSSLGLNPVTASMRFSRALQNRSFSSGQLSQPVVMQKYVSCGATWWMRWWRRGSMTWWSCSHTTQDGRPKYVWDHLCIWNGVANLKLENFRTTRATKC